MKMIFFLFFNIITLLLSNESIASDIKSNLFYDKSTQRIKSDDGISFLSFKEIDAGNTSYFFDYFGGFASIVHDNHSLYSYSSYSIIEEKQSDFVIDCIYLYFKNGNNGLISKEGYCGLDFKFINKTLFSEGREVSVVNTIIDANNKINTSYFMNGAVKYLPIIVFQNTEQYVYKIYKNKDDLINNKYEIISCKNDYKSCNLYKNNTWIVVINNSNPTVKFEELKREDNSSNSILTMAMPVKTAVDISNIMPFTIKSPKAHMLSPTGEQLKSYLIKGDKVTLLTIDNNKCLIRYINNKNKSIDNYVFCHDVDFLIENTYFFI